MEFNSMLNEEVNQINNVVEQFLPETCGKQELLIEAMRYSVLAGGKRIRPMILLETYKLCGGKDINETYAYMAALEFIHTYSLVHDDLPAMDNDDYRRGRLTTHKKYGEDFGILAGDGLLNYAYEIMAKDIYMLTKEGTNNTNLEKQLQLFNNKTKAMQIIAQKAGVYGMVGGQSLDVYLTNKTMQEDDLQFIFDLKTGALIEAAFMAGGMLAGAETTTVAKLNKIGELVGKAFQIQDDILDITSSQEVLGKPVLSDEKNNKTTYVTLYGMDKAREDVKVMSEEAIKLVKEISDNNEFLTELIRKLINREK